MSGFLGRYEYQLDAKGRVSLPAAFRRETEDSRFVLLQVHRPALTLYPQSAWAEVEERLLDLKRRKPDARGYVLSMTSSALEVEPDKQGRILIPAWLQEAASLEGSVLLVGAINQIEIWNPADFRTAMEEGEDEMEKFTPQIFA